MVFVPIVPTVPAEQASLEAQELAREIETAIANYQDDHPRIRQEDIQQALQIARSRAGSDAAGQKVVLAAVLGLIVMAALLAGFLVMA